MGMVQAGDQPGPVGLRQDDDFEHSDNARHSVQFFAHLDQGNVRPYEANTLDFSCRPTRPHLRICKGGREELLNGPTAAIPSAERCRKFAIASKETGDRLCIKRVTSVVEG